MTAAGTRRGMVAFAATAALAGCAWHTEHVLDGADARRLANVQPSADGWIWSPNGAKPIWNPSTDSTTTDPLLAEFRRKTARLATLGEASKQWQDGDKRANLDVGVYANAADAHASMAPFNALSKGWAARTGRVTKATKADGPGEDAWVMRVQGNGAQATYHWRRRNLVLEAHIHCYGACPRDVDAAARTWAEAIDAAARR